MIYLDINDIFREFRKALAEEPLVEDDIMVDKQMKQLGQANNCKIIGSLDAGGYWCTDGIEFPDEESLMWFKLKWSN